ncbi:MAG: M23 family metallopeptidase [Alistipes sp.]|nr:M23 family metallopeptidase [Alistipes sp.]MDE7129329.1 M23 family metallopeptidase [Alistipes sp.]
MKQSDIKGLWRRIAGRRQLSMRDRSSGEEFWHVNISPIGVWGTIAAFVLVICAVLLTLISYTPVLDILPGYRTQSQRIHESLVENIMRVDSMERKIAMMMDYNEAVSTIMNNNTPTLQSTVMTDTIRYDKSRIMPTRADSLLRAALESEYGEYSLAGSRSELASEAAVFTAPISGDVVKRFDPTQGNYGVEIVSIDAESSVAAMENGTVIGVGSTPEHGIEVALQHADGYTSIYRNLSQALVRKGQHVKSGEVIGNISSQPRHDTDREQTSRPASLEFEIWRDGTATNPESYILF